MSTLYERDKVIKSIGTWRYEVELLERPNGLTYIKAESKTDQHTETSEDMSNLSLAMFLFDLKVQELEGI